MKEVGLLFVFIEKMDVVSNYKLIVYLLDGINFKEVKIVLVEKGIFLGGIVYEIFCY